jgi:hypothetical protein
VNAKLVSSVNVYIEIEEVHDIFAVENGKAFDGSRCTYFAKVIEKETLHSSCEWIRIPNCRDSPPLRLALTTSSEAVASLRPVICLQEPCQRCKICEASRNNPMKMESIPVLTPLNRSARPCSAAGRPPRMMVSLRWIFPSASHWESSFRASAYL